MYKSKLFIFLFLMPAVVLYGVFVIYPFLSSLRFSLYNWSGSGAPTNFIGLSNFRYVLFSKDFSGTFWNAILHNLYFFVLSLLLISVFGVAVATILTRAKMSLSQVFQVVYFVPMVVPPIVISYLWAMYLEPNTGAIPFVLNALHLSFLNIPYLGLPSSALPTITLIEVWATLGYSIFIFIPAINNVPSELLESATVDGANGFRRFVSIIVPMIMPTYLTVTTMNFISAFGVFDYIYILEGMQGGPNHSTDVLSVMFYRTAFGSTISASAGGLGLASAMAVVGFVIVVLVSVVLIRLQKRASRIY